jgi:hypothetical protein
VLNKKKKAVEKNKRWHRTLGNVFLLTTLLYSFSGAWHAFAKLPAKETARAGTTQPVFTTSDLAASITPVFAALKAGEKCTGISVVKMEGENYWQLSYQKENNKPKKYIAVNTGNELADGDRRYALSIACRLKKAPPAAVKQTAVVYSFNHRYSMMNKRLPVVEVLFRDGDSYYIETSTGSLAAVVKPSGQAERFSFSNLHMHHYWEMWLGKDSGKTAKNMVLILSTLGLLLLAITGTLMFVKKKLSRAARRL